MVHNLSNVTLQRRSDGTFSETNYFIIDYFSPAEAKTLPA